MLRKRCVFQSYVRRSESREISNDNYTRVSDQSSACRNPPRNPRKSPHGAPKHCLHWPLTTASKESTNKQWLSLTRISTPSISMSICLTFVNKTKEFAHSKHHCKATSSHNSSLTITIITGFFPQICTVPGLITDNPLSQTASYNLTEKNPHPRKAKQHTERQWGLWKDSIDRQTDKTWCTWLADMTGTSGVVTDTFIGLVNNMAPDPGQQC